MLFKYIAPIIFLILGSSQLYARAPIRVNQVDFKTTKEDWIQAEIKLECASNTLPNARSREFVENIGVQLYVAYETDAAKRSYDYYKSEVKIAIVEAREDYNVYFYLPGMIVERDSISNPTPAFYFVGLDVAGNELPLKKGSARMSSNIKNPQMLNSFKEKVNEMSTSTKGLLMPSYYVSSNFKMRVKKQPLYIRLDPK